MLRRLALLAIVSLTGSIAYCENPTVSLQVGDACPNVSLETDQGTTLKIAEHIGSQKIVLFFYPADMTHVCTTQACQYQKQLQEFKAADTLIIGISGDTNSNHQVFRKKNQLTFPLIADPEGKISKAFGVPVREGGQIVRRINGNRTQFKRGVTAGRWTFVVGLDGRIIHKDTDVDARGNSESVLKLVRQLTVATE
ncbi:MAG: peroxiredoxin [Fuerstiella sp.]